MSDQLGASEAILSVSIGLIKLYEVLPAHGKIFCWVLVYHLLSKAFGVSLKEMKETFDWWKNR